MTEQKHHRVYYNNKTVTMDYVTDPKREFALACMRVRDNNAALGYVLTPKGDVFQVTAGSKMARKLTSEQKNDVMSFFLDSTN